MHHTLTTYAPPVYHLTTIDEPNVNHHAPVMHYPKTKTLARLGFKKMDALFLEKLCG
jgi:hypothetical protein